MSWFNAFRGEFGYTYYGEKRTPVTVDVQLVAVVYACVLISIATLIAAAGIRGKERWYTLLRVVFTLAVGSSILLCLYGFCWRTAYIDITSPYIYRSDQLVNGRIGIHIGLKKINITLTGVFEDAKNEVNYNEEVALQKFPGPVGEITHCLKRGLPQPVLNVVEYLSVDAGYLRWGRDYTLAGYFASILLWTAFSFWILGNIMICSVVFYGAFMVTLTGICMVLSTVVFHLLQPKFPVRMSSADISLDMSYGMCFWVILVFGIVTIVIGIILLALDHAAPKTMNKYFLMDTQFVKDEVFTSQMRRTSSLPYFQQNNFRRTSAPVVAGLNKSHSAAEIVQSNPVFDDTIESGNHGNLKRSSTSPGSIHVTCSYDKMHVPKGSQKTSITSLQSIHEFDEDARSVGTSDGTDNLSYVPEETTGKKVDNGHSELTGTVVDHSEVTSGVFGHSEMTSGVVGPSDVTSGVFSHSEMTSAVVKEDQNLNRLKNTYINIEPSHRNSFKVVS